MQTEQKFDIKLPKTNLGKNIQRILGVTEEITKAGFLPICLIGFKKPDKNKIVNSLFATLDNGSTTETVVLELCKQLLIAHGYAVQNKEPEVQVSDTTEVK